MINTRIKLFILKLGFCFFPFVLITQYAVDSVARKHTNVSFKSPLVLDIIPNEIKAPSRESIFVTGRPGAGCFVFLIRDPANQSKIAYDSWGTGGPVSEAFNFQPNRKYTFKLHLPALAGNSLNDKNGLARLIIELDGRVLIDKEVHYFKYSNNDVYVGYNPIGGSVCGDQFAGSIKMNNEFLWYVSPSHSSLVDRFCNYLSHQYGLVFFFFKALGVIVSLFSLALLASHYAFLDDGSYYPKCYRINLSLIFGLFGTILFIFLYFNTRGSFHIFETEAFTNYYDYQANALLHGRLNVPPQAIGGEAFIYHGLYYGYFGITPALLRIPFLICNLPFGILSRFLMTVYFIISIIYAFLILRLSYKYLRGKIVEPPAWAVLLIVLNAGLGSTLLFLGSRSYIYHEAILCGAMFSLVSVYYTLGYLFYSKKVYFITSFLCALLSIHARATPGIFSFGFLILVVLYLGLNRSIDRSRAVLYITICGLGVFTFSLIGYLKFRDFGGFPLKYNVQYTSERLARFGGKEFQLINFPHNFHQYILGNTVILSKHFPFIINNNSFASNPNFVGPKLDMVEPTLSVIWSMPALSIVCLLGSCYSLYRAKKIIASILLIWLAVLPMMLILLSAVVVSHRYTGDFCSFLISVSAISLAALSSQLVRLRRSVVIFLNFITCVSIFVTLMWCIRFQGTESFGVTPKDITKYNILAERIDRLLGVSPKP